MMMDSNEPLTLYALNNMVRSCIEEAMPHKYWVVGELIEVHEAAAGHCYIEIAQRDEATNSIVARARGTIWSRIYSLLRPYFLEQTGQGFAAGIKVMLQVTVEFHELYGYSLNVCDIEPAFTIGDIARRRMQIMQRLASEGVLNLNKELPFPLLPQRVAVISSATAAGYGDFCHQLQGNSYGFKFRTQLFPSPMQGDKVEEGIIAALDNIAADIDLWDVVVIIRGGGSTVDLTCFDTYDLANNCAQFPLPIITGIGHQRDDTLLDAVAHTRVKTPTAAAELLIHSMAAQAAYIDELGRGIADAIRATIDEASRRLHTLLQRLPIATALLMQRHHHSLDLIQHRIDAASPQRILAMGYTLTTLNGRAVRKVDDVASGDMVVTYTADGKFVSEVK